MTPAKTTPYDLFEQAVGLSARFEENFIELGRLLRRLQDDDTDLFKQVCSESGLQLRKAYYLARIARDIEGLPIPKVQLASVGWTRLQVISKVLTPDNWQGWMKAAQEHTARDLTILLQGGTPVPGTRSVVLYFKPREYERFAKCMMAFGAKLKRAGLDGKERALLKLIATTEQRS